MGRRWHVDVSFRALHPLTVTCWAFFCSRSHITVFIISASPEWVHTQFIFQLASLLKAYHNTSRPEKFISHTQNGSLGQNNIVSSSLHKTETMHSVDFNLWPSETYSFVFPVVLKSGGTHSKRFLQEDFLWSCLGLRLSLINTLILFEKSCFNGSDFRAWSWICIWCCWTHDLFWLQ